MTLPAFHIEGAFIYLRNDLQGAPLAFRRVMDEMAAIEEQARATP